jgi:hypothetical protein
MQERRKQHGSFALVVESIANFLSNGNPTASVAFIRIMVAECDHVVVAAVFARDGFDPLLGGL